MEPIFVSDDQRYLPHHSAIDEPATIPRLKEFNSILVCGLQILCKMGDETCRPSKFMRLYLGIDINRGDTFHSIFFYIETPKSERKLEDL